MDLRRASAADAMRRSEGIGEARRVQEKDKRRSSEVDFRKASAVEKRGGVGVDVRRASAGVDVRRASAGMDVRRGSVGVDVARRGSVIEKRANGIELRRGSAAPPPADVKHGLKLLLKKDNYGIYPLPAPYPSFRLFSFPLSYGPHLYF